MNDLFVRRCWNLLCEPVQTFGLDMAALISGGGRSLLKASYQWQALAAHLDGPVVLNSDQLEVLGRLDRTNWVAMDTLPEAAKFLFDSGLVLAENDSRDFSLRDASLRQGSWWPLAAVLHSQARWKGQDSVQEISEKGMDRLDGLVNNLGAPPPSGISMDGEFELPEVLDSPLESLLKIRVSCRNFDGDDFIEISDLSSVLWSGLGERGAVVHESGARFSKKGCPSAGGLHPTEAYLMLRNVRGIDDGLYYYQANGHKLLSMSDRCENKNLHDMAMRWLAGQYWFSNAQALVVLAPRYDRLQWKYRNHSKAYRAAILDVGHLSQTLYLAATQAGLGAFVTAAINECDVEQDLGLQPFGDGPLAIAGFGVRAARMHIAELDPAGAIWQPAGP